MEYYNWTNIFGSKSDSELLRIIEDKRSYTEEARLSAVQILKKRKINSERIESVENKIGERVRRRERVSKIKIPLELSFGYDDFKKYKKFHRNIDIETFKISCERAFYDLKWNILATGANFYYVQGDELRRLLSFTTIDIWFEKEYVHCKGYQNGDGFIIDFGFLNKKIMSFINFFDDILTGIK